MFSKALFKQSTKANGAMWLIITFAVCFMLACVMLISGGGKIGKIADGMEDSIIQSQIEAAMKERAINYYDLNSTAMEQFDEWFLAAYTEAYTDAAVKAQVQSTFCSTAVRYYEVNSAAMEQFDSYFSAAYAQALASGYDQTTAAQYAYSSAVTQLQSYAEGVIASSALDASSSDAQAIEGVIFFTLNPPTSADTTVCQFDTYYANWGEASCSYDVSSLATSSEQERAAYRSEYCRNAAAVFAAGSMTGEAATEQIVLSLADYGITAERYASYGFDYATVKSLMLSALDGNLGETSASLTDEQLTAIAASAYTTAATKLNDYVADLVDQKGYDADSDEALEIKAVIFFTLNPPTETQFDEMLEQWGETPSSYDVSGVADSDRADYRSEYCQNAASIFLAGNMTSDKAVEEMLEVLSEYGVDHAKYESFGYTYFKVKELAQTAITTYAARLKLEIAELDETESDYQAKVAETKAALAGDLTKGFLATLPDEVQTALREVGSMDLYNLIVGSIFYKIAGLLLPFIYVIMVANSLIAGQVDSGSMAYVLSSSAKRNQVTATQALYLVLSVFAMTACTTVTSCVCLAIVKTDDIALTYSQLLLMNLGYFAVLFAVSGICFLASCWFNRSKSSMTCGGGFTMFFLVATISGLFGSEVLPSVVRLDALNFFNYVTIISLFDVISITEGTLAYLWKFAVLFAIGIVCFVIGSRKFRKKDLPL